MRDQNRPSRGCCGVVAGELEARARALVDGLRGEGYWDRILGADMREIVRQVLEAAPPPPPSDLGTKLREDVARIIHAEIAGTDPDELIHHPAAKSWETPTEPRWTQWLELTDAIHALYADRLDALEGGGEKDLGVSQDPQNDLSIMRGEAERLIGDILFRRAISDRLIGYLDEAAREILNAINPAGGRS
jgi:hypothetical protein